MARFSHRWIATAAIALGLYSMGAQMQLAAAQATDDEAAYTRVINGRADRIVARLAIDDAEKAVRVRDCIAGQYRSLRAIHDTRDAKIAEATRPGSDSTVADAWIKVVRKQANLEQFALHRQFVARLSAELSAQQVEMVKDGMTYGVVSITYNRYLELLPDLTDEQKAVIWAHLVEAREYAMDAGSSEEKHGWFRKYKGRINNFVSAAGYDMERAEKDWAARQ